MLLQIRLWVAEREWRWRYIFSHLIIQTKHEKFPWNIHFKLVFYYWKIRKLHNSEVVCCVQFMPGWWQRYWQFSIDSPPPPELVQHVTDTQCCVQFKKKHPVTWHLPFRVNHSEWGRRGECSAHAGPWMLHTAAFSCSNELINCPMLLAWRDNDSDSVRVSSCKHEMFTNIFPHLISLEAI